MLLKTSFLRNNYCLLSFYILLSILKRFSLPNVTNHYISISMYLDVLSCNRRSGELNITTKVETGVSGVSEAHVFVVFLLYN